jgi:uncharacterized protein (TIGR02391 family)
MDRADELTRLATEAAVLRDERYDSPQVKLWKRRAAEVVEREYGKDYVDILKKTLFFRRAITSKAQGQQMHSEVMGNAVEFLEALQNEQPMEPPASVESAPSFLSFDDLHPAIRKACAQLYAAGHLAEAVEKGFRVVRERLRQLTGYETGSEAFGKGQLRLRGAIQPWVDDDFNEGAKFLTMAVDRFRNEKVHTSDAKINEPARAAEYLAMSSLAMRLLDGAYIDPDR